MKKETIIEILRLMLKDMSTHELEELFPLVDKAHSDLIEEMKRRQI